MSHTPGPWTLGKHGAILGAEGRPAFNGTAYPQVALATLDERSDDEREANARLIAAAPELLAALEWCVRHLEQVAERDWEDSTPDGRRFNSTKNALAAIAKATGGAA